MALNANELTLSPQSQSPDIGVIFPKALTIAAAQYGLTLQAVASFQGVTTPFAREELFGAFMVVDPVPAIYSVTVEFKDGGSAVLTVPAWAWIPVTGIRIIASTATAVTVAVGQ